MSETALATLVRRYEHGSRVPGWDDAADLPKDPAVVPDPATTPVPDEIRSATEGYMSRYPDRRSASIPAMRFAQNHHGWLSPTAIEQVACVMRLTPGYLIAVASFYDMFEHHPVGPHTVYVCTNISCSLRGADAIYDELRDTVGGDPDFNIRAFECLGACDIAPMASVNGIYVGPLASEDCEALVTQLREGKEPLPDKQLQRRPKATTYWSVPPLEPEPEKPKAKRASRKPAVKPAEPKKADAPKQAPRAPKAKPAAKRAPRKRGDS